MSGIRQSVAVIKPYIIYRHIEIELNIVVVYNVCVLTVVDVVVVVVVVVVCMYGENIDPSSHLM